jgi:polar amino acid transport system substrate-binding protein
MTTRRIIGVVMLLLSSAGVLSACTSSDDSTTGRTLHALRPASVTPTTTTTPPDVRCDNPLQSYRPTGPLPAPGSMPDGSAMKKIEAKGQLVVGVDENTPGLSARDPGSHVITGFEVDLANALGRAILGDQANVKLVTVVTEQKVPFVQQGRVDLTVSAVSMNCARWEDVDFSSPYLTTDQRVLLRAGSSVTSLDDLAHKKVCVTTGSTTLVTLKDKYPDIVEVVKPARTDCLVALQDGKVEGIASHATILSGLHQQDEDNTKFLNEPINKPNYGIAVAKTADHEFARFVNGVLEQMRDNGELERLYDTWIGNAMPAGTATLPTDITYRAEP